MQRATARAIKPDELLTALGRRMRDEMRTKPRTGALQSGPVGHGIGEQGPGQAPACSIETLTRQTQNVRAAGQPTGGGGEAAAPVLEATAQHASAAHAEG